MNKEEMNAMNTENRNESPVLMETAELEAVTGGTDPSTPPWGAFSGAKVLERATQELGKDYVWGGVGPDAYDCSGLVSYAITGIHAHIYTCTSLMRMSRVANPEPGDICVSNNHCGIYCGGGQMIHASKECVPVIYGPVQGGMIFVRPE